MSNGIDRCEHGTPTSLPCNKCQTEEIRRMAKATSAEFAQSFGQAAKQVGAAMTAAGQAANAIAASGHVLTIDEEADVRAITQRATFSPADLIAELQRVTWPLLMPAEAARMGSLSGYVLRVQERSRDRLSGFEKLKNGVPVKSWSKDELMAQLPIYAKDQPCESLSNLQLMCLTQYALDNCSQKDAVSYDGALQLKMGPELLLRFQRLQPQSPQHKAERFRMAWELYRSGGATLEEITPVLDEVLALPEPETAKPPAFSSVAGTGKRRDGGGWS